MKMKFWPVCWQFHLAPPLSGPIEQIRVSGIWNRGSAINLTRNTTREVKLMLNEYSTENFGFAELVLTSERPPEFSMEFSPKNQQSLGKLTSVVVPTAEQNLNVTIVGRPFEANSIEKTCLMKAHFIDSVSSRDIVKLFLNESHYREIGIAAVLGKNATIEGVKSRGGIMVQTFSS